MATAGVSYTEHIDICWIAAVLTFGLLDVLLTAVAVGSGLAVEQHPLVNEAIRRYSLAVLPLWKAATLGIFYAIYRATPRSYQVGVPLGLALLGSTVAAWNAIVILISLA